MNKRDLIIEKQIARHFVLYNVTQMINNFLIQRSKRTNHDKRKGFLANREFFILLIVSLV